MKKFRLLTLATIFATLAAVGCKDDKPGPDPVPPTPPTELKQQYEWNGKATDIKSVVSAIIPNEIAMPLYIFLSPEEGIGSYTELMGSDREYVMIMIDTEMDMDDPAIVETDNGMTIDLAAESIRSQIYVWYMRDGKAVAEYADDTELTSGILSLKEDPASAGDMAVVDLLLDYAGSDDCLRANFSMSESDIIVPEPDYDYIAEDFDNYAEIRSAFAFDSGGYTFVVMSTQGGYETWEQCLDGGNYVMLAVNPKYIGETIDMKTCDDFSFVNASGMAPAIETVTSDDPETLATILAGEMTVSREGEYTDVRFDVTGRDEIRFHGSVGIHTPKPQNYIDFNGASKPVRAAFYYANYLYLTPGAIDYGEDISLCSQYLVVTMPADLSSGTPVDVASSGEEFMVIFSYEYGEKQIMTSNEERAATGSYTVRSTGENSYEVVLDIAFNDGNKLQCAYSGEFKDFIAEPAKANEYKIGGETFAIGSVVVDARNTVWEAYISKHSGLDTVDKIKAADDVLTVKADASLWTGEPSGFSVAAQDGKELSLTIADNVYNYANGNTGTFSGTVEGTQLYIEFMSYGDSADIYYKGEAVVIK